MTKEEIQALVSELLESQLTAAVSGAFDTIQEHLDKSLTTLKEELKPSQGSSGEAEQPSGTVKARLAVLENQLADAQKLIESERVAREAAVAAQQQAERARKFDSEFETALGKYNILPETREFLVSSLKRELADVQEVEGKFITVAGKSLEEHLEGFMGSPTGQHFLQSQGSTNGLASFGTVDKPGVSQPTVTDSSIIAAFC